MNTFSAALAGNVNNPAEYEEPLTQSGEVAPDYQLIEDSYTHQPAGSGLVLGNIIYNTVTDSPEPPTNQTTSFYEEPCLVCATICSIE